jgi:acyl-CoA thioester hydrolase
MSAVEAIDRSFAIERRVYYQHTDAGGVVFHANYLAFMEQARTEFLMSLGFDVARLAAEAGVMFIVHRVALDFLRPARLNEILSITAETARVGRARVIFRQVVSRADDTLVTGEVQLACVHPQSFKPVPVPSALRARLGYSD